MWSEQYDAELNKFETDIEKQLDDFTKAYSEGQLPPPHVVKLFQLQLPRRVKAVSRIAIS